MYSTATRKRLNWRRVAELAPISGDADKSNAEIVTALRDGHKGEALSLARELDERGPAASVPEAERAPIGNRDHGQLDGVAMVQGPQHGRVGRWRDQLDPQALTPPICRTPLRAPPGRGQPGREASHVAQPGHG